MLCRGAWTADDSGNLEMTGIGDSRGRLARSSNGHQLLVFKVMQPSELGKTSFRCDSKGKVSKTYKLHQIE